MPKLVREGENRAQVPSPCRQDVGVSIVGRRAECAGRLAYIVNPVNPPVLKGLPHNLRIFIPHYLNCFYDKLCPFFIGNLGVKLRVKRRLDIAIENLVEAQHGLAELHISLHVLCTFALDDVEQVLIYFAGHLLPVQEHLGS